MEAIYHVISFRLRDHYWTDKRLATANPQQENKLYMQQQSEIFSTKSAKRMVYNAALKMMSLYDEQSEE